MNIFDIVGPVMVGPSSSHTAGAVRIGFVSRKLLGEPVKSVQLLLYGSFLATGKGHGTDRALVAGLLGMLPDDERVPFAFEEAKNAGMEFTFGEANLKEAHPNSVVLKMVGESGRALEVIAASLGGGRMKICKIDGMEANFCAECPTLMRKYGMKSALPTNSMRFINGDTRGIYLLSTNPARKAPKRPSSPASSDIAALSTSNANTNVNCVTLSL